MGLCIIVELCMCVFVSCGQLEEVRDELQKKESRWGTTLSRYRIKIEGLEARNKELMNDIKMMEEARLEWWQEQVSVCVCVCVRM